ncbi:MAG TPA: PH domain-containing protein [Anaerolineaceae bacterium]|nr:PH domain-containing protein [Anaerolineaceae bacterium]
MEVVATFIPPRRKGLMLHLLIGMQLLAGGGACLLLAVNSASGTGFVWLMLASLVLLAPTPFILYRAYSLSRAAYELQRDGLQLRWGLRQEDIPLPSIEWVYLASDLPYMLPLPWFSAAGAIRGTRHVTDLGLVEFMASDPSRLVLIATPERVYAISPSDPKAFLHSFRYALEMGSLAPIQAFSSVPAVFLRSLWGDRVARILLVIGLGVTLALFVATGLTVATRETISLGFEGPMQPSPPGPPEHLFLLPVLGAIVYAMDILAGMFFYRRGGERPVAYMLWASSPVPPLLLLLAVLNIK